MFDVFFFLSLEFLKYPFEEKKNQDEAFKFTWINNVVMNPKNFDWKCLFKIYVEITKAFFSNEDKTCSNMTTTKLKSNVDPITSRIEIKRPIRFPQNNSQPNFPKFANQRDFSAIDRAIESSSRLIRSNRWGPSIAVAARHPLFARPGPLN